MFFNSLDFAIFLVIVFLLYWFAFPKNLRWQNILLLASSYVFYGWWDWRFLFLLAFSTFLDFFSGLKIEQAQTKVKAKFWLILSIGINLSFLGFFKYYNFFAREFAQLFSNIGFKIDPWTLKIILPVGISFYTFHGLSYIIDIYKKRIDANRNFINYAVFVSFFPLLVAGPIERATHLLPQVQKPRVFNYDQAVDGVRQILWGLFKKVVIADNCAEYANMIFNNSGAYDGSSLFMGAFFFSLQIYGDFSGYSDIALGTSKLFGIELLKNFSFPYFSRDIAEFWRRWHISLTTWFRDYLYIPLGGSKGGTWAKVRNTFIIFLVSGFWHGANWTFIVWGALNAIYFLPLLLSGNNRNNLHIVAQGKYLPSIKELLSMVFTFLLVLFAWIFFRSTDLGQAFSILGKIFSKSVMHIPAIFPKMLLLLIAFFIAVEWIGRESHYALQHIHRKTPVYLRWSFYFILFALIFMYSGREETFIYFQF